MKILVRLKLLLSSIIVLIIVVFVNEYIFNPVQEMNQLKKLLLEREQQLSTVFKKQSAVKNIIENLKSIKRATTLSSDKKGLNNLFEEIVSSNLLEINFNFLNQSTKARFVEYPFNINIKSQFNRVGDYLEYLESVYPPVLLNSITIIPTADEFDLLNIKLAGAIYLPKTE